MLFNYYYQNVGYSKSFEKHKNIGLGCVDFFLVIFFFRTMHSERCLRLCIFPRFRVCNYYHKIF